MLSLTFLSRFNSVKMVQVDFNGKVLLESEEKFIFVNEKKNMVYIDQSWFLT